MECGLDAANEFPVAAGSVQCGAVVDETDTIWWDVPYQVAALFFLEGEGHVDAAADIGPHNEGLYPARMSVLVHVITQGATCLAASERYLPSPP